MRFPVVRFPVEPGHVLAFARATGDWSLAAALPEPGTPVPPTFTSVDAQFDPEHMRGMRPAGVLAASGGPGGSVLHAEQHFEYFAPVRVGDALTVTCAEGRTWTKHGRSGGKLSFREIVKEYRDDRDELVVRARVVLVDTGPSAGGGAAQPVPARPGTAQPGDGPVMTARAGGFAVGQRRQQVVCPEITRTQIVQYAGAAGDYSPLHTDEVQAVRAGFGGVLAHGMMVMAASGGPLADWAGLERLTRYSVRFLRPVRPGDTLTTAVTVQEVRQAAGGAHVDFAISTANRHGAEVLAGHASAQVPGTPARDDD
jgi:acyl dehydratase